MTDETAAEAAGETALVERLQRLEQFFRSERREYVADTVKEARLEIERLRALIREAVDEHDWHMVDPYDRGWPQLEDLRAELKARA